MAGSDSADFDAFYIATVRRVVLYLYAACGDRGDAQDVAQEAFARAWQHWSKVAGYDDPEAWVRTVGWRLMVNRWRGLRRRLATRTRLGPVVDVTGSPSPDRVAIVGALQRLPKPQRQVVALHYLLDLPVNEIAASTGTPVGTVKARLSRARTSLARLLDEHEHEHERGNGPTHERGNGPGRERGNGHGHGREHGNEQDQENSDVTSGA